MTKASAVSATSRQPLSIVREWPRFLISMISVTPGLRCCFLNDALAIAHDQEWSAVGVLRVDLHLGPRVEVGERRLEQRHAGTGHGVFVVQPARFVLVDHVGEGEPELVVREPYRSPVVGRILQHRTGCLER